MVRTTGLANYSDVHFTKKDVAEKIIQILAPSGIILEPFRGQGAFYDPLLNYIGKEDRLKWCEISEGVDFLEFPSQVDWIITNPPFGPLTQMMEKAFEVSVNTAFLMPISKFYSSAPRLKLSRKFAGLKHMIHTGTGREIGFDIGFPFAVMHFQRGYKGPIHESDL